MTEVNNQLLVLARESRGITQSELVTNIPNLNQGNYSKMEKGLLKPSLEVLDNIAQVLGYPTSFFYKEGIRTPISSFYYRKRVSTPKKKLMVLEARLNIARMLVDDLLDSIDIPDFALPKYRISDNLSASEAAVRLREFLKLPVGPIKSLVKVLEAAGVIVYFINTDIEKFDGITLFTDKGHPIIFVNSSMPNDRKRFTIAHELCHLIAHIPYSPLPHYQDEEAEANEFAGEFLMPYLECRYDLLDLKFSQLSYLKTYWKVSKAAIIRRAKDIEAINKDKYQYLYVELSRNGERKKERGTVDLDEPTILNKVLEVYETQLGYTKKDMLSTLSINPTDFNHYFNIKDEINVSPKASKTIPLKPKSA